jgi:hypothetical protein
MSHRDTNRGREGLGAGEASLETCGKAGSGVESEVESIAARNLSLDASRCARAHGHSHVRAHADSHGAMRQALNPRVARDLRIWHVPCSVGGTERRRRSVVTAAPIEMALPFGETPGARDPRALAILAKTIYRELRSSGFEARDVMTLAGELLSQVTSDVKSERGRRR